MSIVDYTNRTTIIPNCAKNTTTNLLNYVLGTLPYSYAFVIMKTNIIERVVHDELA
jgi:hypothetical protein